LVEAMLDLFGLALGFGPNRTLCPV
jgi:hypothetical protein